MFPDFVSFDFLLKIIFIFSFLILINILYKLRNNKVMDWVTVIGFKIEIGCSVFIICSIFTIYIIHFFL
ncbi:hypothetical protein DRF69_18400 [Chryseobacterium sp. 5_R23647]|nr:hypothetical protein DRF69_18400 [Chryseobacterium sp. 5_R23647]